MELVKLVLVQLVDANSAALLMSAPSVRQST